MTHDDYGRIEDGQRAAQAKAVVNQRLLDNETAILNAACTQYRAGTLDPQRAYGVLAQIAALRDLAFALDKDVRKASEARARLVSPGPTGTATRRA